MITNELLGFVKEELSKGTTEEEIKKALMEGGGWSDSDIKEAFDAVGIASKTLQNTMASALAPEIRPVHQEFPKEPLPPAGVFASAPVPALTPSPVVAAPLPSPNMEPLHEPTGPQPLRISPSLEQKVIQHAPLGMGVTGIGVGSEISSSSAPVGMRERLVLDVKPSPLNPSMQSPLSPSGPKPFTSSIGSTPLASFTSTPSFSPASSPISPPAAGNPPPNFLSPYLNPPARDTVKIERGAEKGGHGFLYFLIFLIVLLLILGGGAFAYVKGLLPSSVSIPFLDSLNAKFSGTDIASQDQNAPEGSGLSMSDPSLVPAEPPGRTPSTGSGQAVPPPPAPQGPAYFTDRVKIILPSGSPVSVTTIASSIASELRGKIATCEYAATENSCIITVPAKDAAELEKIVGDLKKDKRLKGAELVAM